ncbi:hypothetical protein AU476_34140 [Cupriavidus sp. UYMSc13B]|nr:hypothetical protein AU476_34140 [Cupriavidus sp. UYMSc13B]
MTSLIGGEAFVVLLPHTGAEAAFAVTERVRQAVEQQSAHGMVTAGQWPSVLVPTGDACRARTAVPDTGHRCSRLADEAEAVSRGISRDASQPPRASATPTRMVGPTITAPMA